MKKHKRREKRKIKCCKTEKRTLMYFLLLLSSLKVQEREYFAYRGFHVEILINKQEHRKRSEAGWGAFAAQVHCELPQVNFCFEFFSLFFAEISARRIIEVFKIFSYSKKIVGILFSLFHAEESRDKVFQFNQVDFATSGFLFSSVLDHRSTKGAKKSIIVKFFLFFSTMKGERQRERKRHKFIDKQVATGDYWRNNIIFMSLSAKLKVAKINKTLCVEFKSLRASRQSRMFRRKMFTQIFGLQCLSQIYWELTKISL